MSARPRRQPRAARCEAAAGRRFLLVPQGSAPDASARHRCAHRRTNLWGDPRAGQDAHEEGEGAAKAALDRGEKPHRRVGRRKRLPHLAWSSSRQGRETTPKSWQAEAPAPPCLVQHFSWDFAGRRPISTGQRACPTVFGNGTGFVWYGDGTQEQDVIQRALIVEMKAGLVTVDEAEGGFGG